MEERLYFLLNTAQHVLRKFVDEEGLARTEKTGVIRRRTSADDRRAAQLFLTPKGRRLLGEIHQLNQELNAALREGFSSEELAVVMRFLRHVRALPEARGHSGTDAPGDSET